MSPDTNTNTPMTLTLADRAASYASVFPSYPAPRADERWLDAVWMMGNNYRSTAPGFYGSYPPGYLKRIHALFPDARKVLHVFSGSLTHEQVAEPAHHEAIVRRIDARAEPHPGVRPSFVTDITNEADFDLLHTYAGGQDLILADPPYSVEDAEHYGPPMVDRKKAVAACAKLLRPGGHLVWMDQVLPMYRKDALRHVGNICVVRSTNHRVRLVSIFERVGGGS